MLHAAAELAGQSHRSLVEAVEVLEAAGVAFTPDAGDDVVEIVNDVGRFADTLDDLAAGQPQRWRPDDPLPYSFADKVCEEYRARRPLASARSPAKRRSAA
jgi:hypothetical protein